MIRRIAFIVAAFAFLASAHPATAQQTGKSKDLHSFAGEILRETRQDQSRAIDGGFMNNTRQSFGAGHQIQLQFFGVFVVEFVNRDRLVLQL